HTRSEGWDAHSHLHLCFRSDRHLAPSVRDELPFPVREAGTMNVDVSWQHQSTVCTFANTAVQDGVLRSACVCTTQHSALIRELDLCLRLLKRHCAGMAESHCHLHEGVTARQQTRNIVQPSGMSCQPCLLARISLIVHAIAE